MGPTFQKRIFPIVTDHRCSDSLFCLYWRWHKHRTADRTCFCDTRCIPWPWVRSVSTRCVNCASDLAAHVVPWILLSFTYSCISIVTTQPWYMRNDNELFSMNTQTRFIHLSCLPSPPLSLPLPSLSLFFLFLSWFWSVFDLAQNTNFRPGQSYGCDLCPFQFRTIICRKVPFVVFTVGNRSMNKRCSTRVNEWTKKGALTASPLRQESLLMPLFYSGVIKLRWNLFVCHCTA